MKKLLIITSILILIQIVSSFTKAEELRPGEFVIQFVNSPSSWNITVKIQAYNNQSTSSFTNIASINSSQIFMDKKPVKAENKIYKFGLHQNYPNPFNPSTTISFYMPRDNFIRVNIYDYMVQLVKSLYSGYVNFGYHSFVWDGLNSNNTIMSSGVYIYTVETDGKVFSRKMVLQK